MSDHLAYGKIFLEGGEFWSVNKAVVWKLILT